MSQLISYDDRDGQIWLNGEFVPWRDAKVHVLTHALHYGSAVFEGERVVGIHQQVQNRARQLIEEFMIATNT